MPYFVNGETHEFGKGHINGSEIVDRFTVLHERWDMDNEGYITEDGNVWLCSHGNVYRASWSEIHEYILDTQESLDGLRRARDTFLSKEMTG